MILSWMTYAIAVGSLIVVATAAVDRIAVARDWPKRVVWAGALAAALLWPGAIAARALWPPLATPILPFAVTVAPLRTIASHDGGTGIAIDRAVVMTWIVVSSLLLLRLVVDVVSLRRLRRSWPLREIDGRLTRLTKHVGPAVVGLRPMELVLPEWILTFEEPLRALVLRHEEEHRKARDPHLLIMARVATLVMPWNPAIWYTARRLRLAIELDCDARVLRAHPSAERYGMLLLTIAQRRTAARLALAPMLSDSTTQLERRILAMQPARCLSRTAATAATLVAVTALALACSVQSDAPTASTAAKETSGPTFASGKSGYQEFQVEKPATPLPGNWSPRYPTPLRRAGVEGKVLAQFVVNRDGTVDLSSFKVLQSPDQQFTQAVKGALPSMRFSPAQVGGRPVRQLVQMPFVFALHR